MPNPTARERAERLCYRYGFLLPCAEGIEREILAAEQQAREEEREAIAQLAWKEVGPEFAAAIRAKKETP